MIEMEGKQFTLFWDIDRQHLTKLSFEGRARWLHERIKETLRGPLEVLASTDSPFPWLAITELVCAGIEALGGFYGDEEHADGTSFCKFVHAFMHADFGRIAAGRNGQNKTYCEHLREYFRHGLDHGFAIEWGGLWFADEQGVEGYLRPNKDGKGIAVCPRALLADFRHAVEQYFARLLQEGENSLIGRNFQARFNSILQQRGRTR